MKFLCFLFCIATPILSYTQTDEVNLQDFTLSNITSPAFLLLEESPTDIYTPDNLKPLIIHTVSNFNGNLSVEFVPYFYLNTSNRTYFNYIGVVDADNLYDINNVNPNVKQRPFSGILRTLSISGAYTDKEFSGFDEPRKTYSLGARTTILRFFEKDKVYKDALKLSDKLSTIDLPRDLIKKRDSARAKGEKNLEEFYQNAIKSYYENKEENLLKPFYNTIKPIFKIDGAIAYSSLFATNDISSGTVNRFGSWVIAEASILLNSGSINRKANNYFNLFALGRYIEDEFNFVDDRFITQYHRDIGGKAELEIGKIAISYEYISRNGSVHSESSVGNIKYTLSENISLFGGFGKDFELEENLVTLFGINWGLNIIESDVKIK